MSGDEDDDKQHEPTDKKLDDARRKGEVPRSTDLITAAAYAGFVLAATTLGPGSLSHLAQTLSSLLSRADGHAHQMSAGGGLALMGNILGDLAVDMAPWAIFPATMAILAVVAQRSFTVTLSKVQPKLNRISPLAGFKNKFGRNGLFEFAKSFVKLVIYCVILGVFLYDRLPEILGSVALHPNLVVTLFLELSLRFCLLAVLVAFCVGGIDALWQRAEHLRKNRMSHKDLTDESKESEGDPHMKQQRRQKGYDIATNHMLADVPKADVVIVNPTHFAVALQWDRATGRAPLCVAKGVDEIAARIRERAVESGVPLHSDPPTARLLHALMRVGDEVQPDHYAAVAVAIRFAETMRAKARKR